MYVIAVISLKGGSGKTTITLAAAVAAQMAGKETLILDVDPQTSAARWKERRGEDLSPAVIDCQPGGIERAIENARGLGFKWVFIDTPGHDMGSACAAASVADLVLVPTKDTVLDLETLRTMKNILAVANNPPAFVVINAIHPSATERKKITIQMAQEYSGIPVAPFVLTQRSDYAAESETGQGPNEFNPSGAAAKEISSLVSFIKKHESEVGKPAKSSPAPKAQAKARKA